jgi:hypothetical protein
MCAYIFPPIPPLLDQIAYFRLLGYAEQGYPLTFFRCFFP